MERERPRVVIFFLKKGNPFLQTESHMESSVYKTDESRATQVEVGMIPMDSYWLESLLALKITLVGP